MKLVLVESPTKARKLSQYLGKDFTVIASMGHVRDLPPSKLGVDVENNFEPTYEITKGRKLIIQKIKKQAVDAEKVYLATDPDREGEAIAWHLQYLLSEKKKGTKKASKDGADRFCRSSFHEITKEAVLEALNNPGVVNIDLVDAQQARRVVDRLVGYKLSPVLWRKVRRGLSAGRVQSVALRLIVEREREIKAFIPKEYWEVDVLLGAKNGEFLARVIEMDGKKYEPVAEKDVKPFLEALQQASYSIASIEKTARNRSSLPPYTTSTLQQAAANKFGWSAKQTMSVAQHLYEEGLITYHRTDSVALSAQAIAAVRDYIPANFGKEYLPSSPNYFKKSSKNAQEAHEAIRPTSVGVQDPNLEARDQKLYELIWKRFVSSQMTPAVYDQTAVLVQGKHSSNSFMLKSNGSVQKFDGWTRLYPQKEENQLPLLEEKEALDYKDTKAEQKFTQPPARYNDASLIKTMEKLGIGRPSTYASIISVILDRAYVERIERAFHTTVVGETVADFLLTNFPKEMDYQFTADMEDNLDAIARGEKAWKQVVKTFFSPFEKNVAKVLKEGVRAQVPVEETGEICPECKKGTIVIRSGRFGKFYSCSDFPECKYTQTYKEKVEGMKCPDCNEGDIIVKRTRRGKTFYGCSRYPDCKYASWNKPTAPGNNSETTNSETIPETNSETTN